MTDARERVRAEAEERAEQDSCTCDGCKMQEFIAGRTVTAEQVDEVAIYLANVDGLELRCVPAEDEAWSRYRYLAREALRAAGFIVEETRPHERSG